MTDTTHQAQADRSREQVEDELEAAHKRGDVVRVAQLADELGPVALLDHIAEKESEADCMPMAWVIVNAPDHVIAYLAELVQGNFPPTDREVEIMRHTVGADSAAPGFRNYFCADAEDEELLAMERRGLMVHTHDSGDGKQRYYKVAAQWLKVMGIESRA